ncbi:hypothetical protein FJ981_02250 [Mesorhizobium sp. B1-1-4]|uniref:hypothetical protein n=1 Tax=Mesorhizobium sp. B1-1-4 TaxID=2589980 RepID=UPI0011267F49|nr:hypothetical protein [Mesorhizobium sp. B1-1-4]TPN60374.1 hypothetical protein FJ981_02250 [Mesorhizobium sp. B1-1-4]
MAAFFCLLLLSQKAVAGWYHVENYEGSIGPDPVHLSLQTYDSFGSGITVEGSYFYDAGQSPIALYGTVSGTRRIARFPSTSAKALREGPGAKARTNFRSR